MLEIVPRPPAPEYPALVGPMWGAQGLIIVATNGAHTDWQQVSDHMTVAILCSVVAIVGYTCVLVQCERCRQPAVSLYVLRDTSTMRILNPERVCGDCLTAEGGTTPRYDA